MVSFAKGILRLLLNRGIWVTKVKRDISKKLLNEVFKLPLCLLPFYICNFIRLNKISLYSMKILTQMIKFIKNSLKTLKLYLS
jgi:hypothetical protein